MFSSRSLENVECYNAFRNIYWWPFAMRFVCNKKKAIRYFYYVITRFTIYTEHPNKYIIFGTLSFSSWGLAPSYVWKMPNILYQNNRGQRKKVESRSRYLMNLRDKWEECRNCYRKHDASSPGMKISNS